MTNKRIAQTNQQQKNEKPQGSGIFQRAAVRSVSEAEVQSTEDKEAQPLGNSALSKDFSRVPISTTKPQQIMAKLMIGPVGDKYEQEADRVAAQVVQRINAPTCVRSGEDETVQREMEIKDNEARLMRSPILQRKSSDGGMAATPDLEASINRARGGGQFLTDNIREAMEQAFGANFSGVKVHTDTQADQFNQSIQAKAFTTGQDVFFRQGEYSPGRRGGQELLAHELTHVVQQSGREPVVQRVERQTTIYTRTNEQWKKNMQIIDSTDISDYVHVSRSTISDSHTFPKKEIPQGTVVTPNDTNKRQLVETATSENSNFNRDQYKADNNVHITLEGRYMEVMRTLATQMFDNREAIKNGPPVVDFANLNFGDVGMVNNRVNEQHIVTPIAFQERQRQFSNHSIQQWINIAADDTEDFLRTNIRRGDLDNEQMSLEEREQVRIDQENQVNELVGVVHNIRDSTLNFTNQLIASTPALAELEAAGRLVHYSGTPWARTR